jgi:hypothetical protein
VAGVKVSGDHSLGEFIVVRDVSRRTAILDSRRFEFMDRQAAISAMTEEARQEEEALRRSDMLRRFGGPRALELWRRQEKLRKRHAEISAMMSEALREEEAIRREAAQLADDSMCAPNPERWIERASPSAPPGLLASGATAVLSDWREEQGFARLPDDVDDGLWTNDDLIGMIGTWP